MKKQGSKKTGASKQTASNGTSKSKKLNWGGVNAVKLASVDLIRVAGRVSIL